MALPVRLRPTCLPQWQASPASATPLRPSPPQRHQPPHSLQPPPALHALFPPATPLPPTHNPLTSILLILNLGLIHILPCCRRRCRRLLLGPLGIQRFHALLGLHLLVQRLQRLVALHHARILGGVIAVVPGGREGEGKGRAGGEGRERGITWASCWDCCWLSRLFVDDGQGASSTPHAQVLSTL